MKRGEMIIDKTITIVIVLVVLGIIIFGILKLNIVRDAILSLFK